MVESAFVCIWWGDKYPAEYVRNLYLGLRRHGSSSLPFICVYGGRSRKVRSNSGIRFVKAPNDYAGWWQKINLFNRRFLGIRHLVYWDLDTVILKSLKGILSRMGRQDWLFAQDPLDRLSSSFMMIDTQSVLAQRIYGEFDPRIDMLPGDGDQDYLRRFLSKPGGRVGRLKPEEHYSYKCLVNHEGWRNRVLNSEYRSVRLTDVISLNFHGTPNPIDLSRRPSRWKHARHILKAWRG